MNYLVAIPLDKSLAELVGKLGTHDGISFYNRKYNENAIVGLFPTSFEGKTYGVAQCLLLSNVVVISTASIDSAFGETLLACSLIKRHVIFTDENNVDKFTQNLGINDFEIINRGNVLESIIKIKTDPSSEGTKRVDLDSVFIVKGIGVVVLGVVTHGNVKVHDELYHNSGKKVSIRSIQVQDEDKTEAGAGTHVGLGLKGLEENEIRKGDLLSDMPIKTVQTVSGEILQSKSYQEQISVGSMYDFVCGFSHRMSTVVEFVGNRITLKLETPLSINKKDEFLLVRNKKPRIFASGIVTGAE